MKKLIYGVVIMLLCLNGLMAQEVKDMYLFKKVEDAEALCLKLKSELQLTEAEYARVHELILESAQSQQEQFKNAKPDAEMLDMINARQTAHIENGIQEILGAEKYKLYEQKKSAIASNVSTTKTH